MELISAASIVAAAAAFIVLFVYVQRRVARSTQSDSSDDETSDPLSVNVVVDHNEQDSLLPSFAGLLRSPWNSVTDGREETPKRMQPVRKGSRSLSLMMPLPLRKKSKKTEVQTKKVHVPFFFPLLDETAEWWQTQQPASLESKSTQYVEEPETESESCALKKEEVSTCHQTKQLPQADYNMHQSGQLPQFELNASPLRWDVCKSVGK